jgi:hypothetical protein
MAEGIVERAVRAAEQRAWRVGHQLRQIGDNLSERRRMKMNAHRPDALFIWVPKSAGTSLNVILTNYGSQTFLTIESARKYFRNQGVVTFGHISIPSLIVHGIVSHEYLNGSWKFAFVRNPFDRAVSLYEYLRKCGTLPPSTTFSLFCSFLEARAFGKIGDFNHVGLNQLNCQVAWLFDVNGAMLPDFIGRFEQLDRDMVRVFERLEIPNSMRSFPHENRSERKDLASYYTDREEGIVRDVYREDFVNLDYSKVAPWRRQSAAASSTRAA